jgi:hypothetical protein
MGKILQLFGVLASAFTYFCVATTITMIVAVSVFVMKGGASGDKGLQLMAVLNGLDLHDFWTKLEETKIPKREEQLSYEEVLEARVKAGLDFDMRERAIQRALGDLRGMEISFRSDRGKFEHDRKQFSDDLKKQQEQAENVALQELQETLSVLSPKQAKEQIRMWLDSPRDKYPIPGRDVMKDVVTMLKSFSPDRMAKFAKEFKTPEESKILHEILEHIRIGPKEELIQDTRDRLNDSAALRNSPKQ